MAEQHHPTDEHAPSGGMDVTEHVKMWHAFWNGAKWSALGLIVIAGLLFIFRTHNG